MTIKKILVATDFSKEAEIALNQSISIARHTGAAVTMVHAMGLSLSDDMDLSSAEVTNAYQAQLKEIEKDAREKLEKIRLRHKGQGVDISHVFIDTMPDKGVLTAASESETDLIVVGSHDRGRVAAFFLGSVSKKIAHLAKCDVLVARGLAPQGGYKRILVPTDFSEHSELAIARAIELVEPGGEIEIVHSWQLPGGPATYWGSFGEGLRADIQKSADTKGVELLAKYATDKVSITFSTIEGSPRRTIERYIADQDFGVVVMGTHGRGGIEKLVLGSVAESILAHAKSSVYLVRK